jgi:3-dehydroquinate synthase II
MTKQIWIRADRSDDGEVRKELVISGLESGATGAIVRPEDSDFKEFGKIDLMFNDCGDLSGAMSGKIVSMKKPEEQEAVLNLAGKTDVVVLDTSDWTVIPLENMIAKFDSKTKVFACADTTEQAELFLTTLEKGVDGIVIENVDTVNEIKKMISSSENLELETVTITDVKNLGMGDRVCVDTCSMMVPGEGMLVGSQSSCMFLIQSESENVGYVEARPFRVNAGAVHAYTFAADGTTKYLAELKSGDMVLLADKSGNIRPAAVGRCKIESRPLVLVETKIGDKRFTTVLQNAETVKIVGPEGSVSVANLKKGDKVYARVESGGRHFGMKIKETIREI